MNVYSHGRPDGEQCSSSIIEGLSHSLPVISHSAPSMGQVAQIGDAGKVVTTYKEYADVMRDLLSDDKYYKQCSENAAKRYNMIYNVDSIIGKFIELYKTVTNV